MVSWRDTPRSDYYQGKVEAVHRDVGHILLVEDDVRFAQSMQRLLSGAGFDVTVTHTGSAARAELARGDFHLALVDMNLPDMSGHEIILETSVGRARVCGFRVVWQGATTRRGGPRKEEQHRQAARNPYNRVRSGPTQWVSGPEGTDASAHAASRGPRSGQLRFLGSSRRSTTRS